MTCHPSVENEFPLLLSKSTVIEEHIITSRGPGTAIPFSLAIIKYLLDSKASKAIADDICI